MTLLRGEDDVRLTLPPEPTDLWASPFPSDVRDERHRVVRFPNSYARAEWAGRWYG
jgi:hypothetical protein